MMITDEKDEAVGGGQSLVCVCVLSSLSWRAREADYSRPLLALSPGEDNLSPPASTGFNAPLPPWTHLDPNQMRTHTHTLDIPANTSDSFDLDFL